MKKIIIAIIFSLFSFVANAKDSSYSFEFFGGTQFNIPTSLTIKQKGEETIKISRAEYLSDAWTWPDSPYYTWRIAKWKQNKGWELELVHEKIILKNKPPDVQYFEISHGYNLITINRAGKLPNYYNLIWRLGAGIVLAHPETEVRNKKNGNRRPEPFFPEGFYIGGPTAQISLGKKFNIYHGLFGILETKFTASYADVLIADGHAEVPNAAFHTLFGIGYENLSK